jgi:hypothetical protein
MGINEENAKEITMFVVDECCWPMWWRPWSWDLLPLKSKVQHLMGANNFEKLAI